MTDLGDTQPNRSVVNYKRQNELDAPPRILFWAVVGLFLVVLVGGFAGVFIFRETLQPSQQQRIIDQFPFMRSFLKPTPEGGILPTVAPPDEGSDPLDLLNMPVAGTPSATKNSDADMQTEEAETQPTDVPTDQPTKTSELPSATPTQPPTATSTSLPPTPIPTATQVTAAADTLASSNASTLAIPNSGRMFGFRHEQQRWNNCGPANITMALSFYGWQQDQTYAANILKPNREDKNVSPHELAQFVNQETGVRAIVRMGGNIETLKALVANEFPVIIETGAMFEAYDWIGHYRTLIAYDDVFRTMYFFDSFLGIGENGQGVTESYENVDKDWQAFNRTFIVLYQQGEEARLQQVLGELYDEAEAAAIAFETAQDEARANPQNGHAWFNMGTSLTAMGRYQEAATAFDQARRLDMPWRMLWYQFGPFEAYYQVGRYDDILSLVQINLNNAEELEETYFWQGRVFEAQGNTAQAANSYRRALNYNPNFTEARNALDTLS